MKHKPTYPLLLHSNEAANPSWGAAPPPLSSTLEMENLGVVAEEDTETALLPPFWTWHRVYFSEVPSRASMNMV